jgi:hypothetical protein
MGIKKRVRLSGCFMETTSTDIRLTIQSMKRVGLEENGVQIFTKKPWKTWLCTRDTGTLSDMSGNTNTVKQLGRSARYLFGMLCVYLINEHVSKGVQSQYGHFIAGLMFVKVSCGARRRRVYPR